ncbi:NAD(P)H-dependent oxidoreductase [Enterovibrio coralii]|uniref:NAD(P)H dehydrogenase n=1 Tax=Enterovibrio coralii TaxID=294935 RepID=A0A135I458_9GAMM|nr:NAD(P)H-dependent oxidoreductase [Enterovibrio coralii]KXF80214.1 NAD(P)H dehydrogenase [Enterovibrio coralii]
MSRILLVSGHPDLKASHANIAILNALSNVSDLSVRKLDVLYPSFDIDVAAEQQALVDAELVIFQFPLYWSTYPAIMKQWFDAVFTYNFAFGPEGDKLKGKKVILSITCGATENSYAEGEFNFFALERYLDAAMHPANAAQMDIVDEVITFEMNAIVEEGGDKSLVNTLSLAHAEKLKAAIQQHIS